MLLFTFEVRRSSFTLQLTLAGLLLVTINLGGRAGLLLVTIYICDKAVLTLLLTLADLLLVTIYLGSKAGLLFLVLALEGDNEPTNSENEDKIKL